MRIYLAGPMRGIPDFNFPAFHKTAAWLREQGHTVFNPAERDESAYGKLSAPTGSEQEISAQTGMTPLAVRRDCFLADTDWICRYADGIALMPGWESSKGARAELALAEAIGLEVIRL